MINTFLAWKNQVTRDQNRRAMLTKMFREHATIVFHHVITNIIQRYYNPSLIAFLVPTWYKKSSRWSTCWTAIVLACTVGVATDVSKRQCSCHHVRE